MDDQVIPAALNAVGNRLRRLRTTRGVSLRTLSVETGISTSTLSRLETGQRRASLELLLPIAAAYRVPLDDLVGAPEVGDPRIRLKPKRVHGRVVIPLTPYPSEVQAWKIIIPGNSNHPELRVHQGSEWIYVLTGQMRLILADQDLVLTAGEAAHFDTRQPHWFGSADGQQAEVLSLFGAQGEQVHTRTHDHRDPIGQLHQAFPSERE